MSVGKRVITIELSEQGIDKAIKELADYKQEFLKKVDLLREKSSRAAG